jgi:hypothetical protein
MTQPHLNTLTEAQTKKVIERIRAKGEPPTCTVCGSQSWSITPYLAEVRMFHGRDFVLGGTSIPLVPVICNTCGNTLLISAIVLGIIDRETGEAIGG